MSLINDYSYQVMTDQRERDWLDWRSATGGSGWH